MHGIAWLSIPKCPHAAISGRQVLITAADDEEGIALGLQHIPNLVITDLRIA